MNENKKPASASEKRDVKREEMKTYQRSSQRPIEKADLKKYVPPPPTVMGSSNNANSFNQSKEVGATMKSRPTRTNRAFALRQQLNTKNEVRKQSVTPNEIETISATKGGCRISRTGMGRYSVRKPNGKKHLSHFYQVGASGAQNCSHS